MFQNDFESLDIEEEIIRMSKFKVTIEGFVNGIDNSLESLPSKTIHLTPSSSEDEDDITFNPHDQGKLIKTTKKQVIWGKNNERNGTHIRDAGNLERQNLSSNGKYPVSCAKEHLTNYDELDIEEAMIKMSEFKVTMENFANENDYGLELFNPKNGEYDFLDDGTENNRYDIVNELNLRACVNRYRRKLMNYQRDYDDDDDNDDYNENEIVCILREAGIERQHPNYKLTSKKVSPLKHSETICGKAQVYPTRVTKQHFEIDFEEAMIKMSKFKVTIDSFVNENYNKFKPLGSTISEDNRSDDKYDRSSVYHNGKKSRNTALKSNDSGCNGASSLKHKKSDYDFKLPFETPNRNIKSKHENRSNNRNSKPNNCAAASTTGNTSENLLKAQTEGETYCSPKTLYFLKITKGAIWPCKS